MLKRFLALIVATAAAWAPQVHAQGYPSKPIRVVVGYAPGGSADAGIRPLAKVLETLLGQPMVMEYKPGAAGGVAMEFIAKAPVAAPAAIPTSIGDGASRRPGRCSCASGRPLTRIFGSQT
jgi:tripartite-type tricarboxylate transporter receptor subunit TctC